MCSSHPDYPVSFARAQDGWTWRITLPEGAPISGWQANLETARRTAAFAAAVLATLDRARRRRRGC
jgi:hypothetical protein